MKSRPRRVSSVLLELLSCAVLVASPGCSQSPASSAPASDATAGADSPATIDATAESLDDAGADLPAAIDGGFTLLGGAEAPATVFVDALAATGDAGMDLLTSRYDWDFGDPTGRWDQLVGWNAAHTYDSPGTYPITLTVTDATGAITVYRQSVTVSADTRTPIYVATAGSDSNDGHDEAHAVATIGRVDALIGAAGSGPFEIFFHRGDAFDWSEGLTIATNGTLVGAYGTGALPRLNHRTGAVGAGCVGGDASGDFIVSNADGVVIQDLSFDTPGRIGDGEECAMPFAINVHGTNTTVRRSEFLNVGYGLQTNSGPKDVAIVDDTAPLPSGLRAYLAWVQGSDFVIVGNDVANSTREHCIRAGGAVRVNLAENTLANLDRRPPPNGPCVATDAGPYLSCDPGDQQKATITAHHGDHFYLRHNHLLGNTDYGTQWTVFEASTLDAQPSLSAEGSYSLAITLYPYAPPSAGLPGNEGVDYFVIRNVIEQVGYALVSMSDPAMAGTRMRVWIVNNTSAALHGYFLDYWGTNVATGDLTLANNLVTGTPHADLKIESQAPIGASSHDTWPLDDFSVDSVDLTLAKWSTATGVDGDRVESIDLSADAGFAPAEDAATAHGATPIPQVFEDYYGKPRPITGWTTGAVQVP